MVTPATSAGTAGVRLALIIRHRTEFWLTLAWSSELRLRSLMRAIWRGSISFGLVNVPVKPYTAVREHDLHLHQVHDADHGRIRYQRRCEVCGKVIDFSHIQRAYDDGEHTVVLTKEEREGRPAAVRGGIGVRAVAPTGQTGPRHPET